VSGPTGRFGPSERLLRSSEYQHVAQQGRRAVSNAFVVVVARRAAPGGPRLGITASRRVGGAVERNRVKRRIREWFRSERRAWQGPLDVLVIARQPATQLEGVEFGERLSRLVARAVEES
jgi:ribonuclease P protein component